MRADKEREVRDGHDGTWVAHPALVPIARDIFDRFMPSANQVRLLSLPPCRAHGRQESPPTCASRCQLNCPREINADGLCLCIACFGSWPRMGHCLVKIHEVKSLALPGF